MIFFYFRIIYVTLRWLDLYPYDFDERGMDKELYYIYKESQSIRGLNLTEDDLNAKFTTDKQRKSTLESLKSIEIDKNEPKTSFLKYKAKEIAEQLCLIGKTLIPK